MRGCLKKWWLSPNCSRCVPARSALPVLSLFPPTKFCRLKRKLSWLRVIDLNITLGHINILIAPDWVSFQLGIQNVLHGERGREEVNCVNRIRQVLALPVVSKEKESTILDDWAADASPNWLICCEVRLLGAPRSA